MKKRFFLIDLGKKVVRVNIDQIISVEYVRETDEIVVRMSKHLFYKMGSSQWYGKKEVEL